MDKEKIKSLIKTGENQKRILKGYLHLLICSLKSFAKWLNFSDKCLWSELKVANIRPIVNTAPRLKINREIIISSTDHEPEKINLISWYAKKIPKRIKRTIIICSNKVIDLFSISTTNLFFDQPNYEKDDYQNYHCKHPIKNCSLFHRLKRVFQNIKNFRKISRAIISRTLGLCPEAEIAKLKTK